MVAVIQNLNINWARVLLKLIRDEVDLIIDKDNDGKSMVEVKKSLRMCAKISWMILKRYPNEKCWKDSVPFNEKKFMPQDQRQLEMNVGIVAELFNKSHNKPAVRACLLAFRQSNPNWTMPEDKEP